MKSCVVCGAAMSPVLVNESAHPSCILFDDSETADPLALKLKKHLIEMIKWADANTPRSLQTAIGPSEIGDPCDRRIGYHIAEVPKVNVGFDPWAAVVGTALHSWLDDAITAWLKAHNSTEYITETPVVLDDFVKGRSDLYQVEDGVVIDHKGAGPSVMRKVVKDGPGPGYVVQVQCYGYGYERLGYKVNKVALAFYPRAGWLRDMYVWTADYDRSVAERALARLSRIATEVVSLDILKQGHGYRWEQIAAEPSDSCGFCPWYKSDRNPEIGANETGCPGRHG